MRHVWQMAQVWAVLAIVGMLAVLAAACGDGAEPQAEGTPCQALQALKAYRYSFSLKVESPEPEESPAEAQPTPTSTLIREFTGPFLFEYNIEASFVAPDRFDAFTSGAGNPFTMIVIGDQAWIQTDNAWMPTSNVVMSYKPANICEAVLADLDLFQVEPQEEKLNDVKALHYTFSQVSSEQAWAKIFGAGSDLDVLLKTLDVDLWLAEKGNWPVRMEIDSSGLYGDGRELRAHLLLDIRDANSGDIRVEPPS